MEKSKFFRYRSIKALGWHFFGVSPLGAFGAFFAVFILLLLLPLHFSCPRHYTTVTQIKEGTRHLLLADIGLISKDFFFQNRGFKFDSDTLRFNLFVSMMATIYEIHDLLLHVLEYWRLISWFELGAPCLSTHCVQDNQCLH